MVLGLAAVFLKAFERLRAFAIYFVGFDIIGDNISEMNITSPRLLAVDDQKMSAYRQLAEKLISDCNKGFLKKNLA